MQWTWPRWSMGGIAAGVLALLPSAAWAHAALPRTMTPRPDLLFPAYFSGRNLAESYYLAIPALSWQNIVVGDPLCSLGSPGR